MVKPGQKVIISLPLTRTMLVRHPAWASKLESMYIYVYLFIHIIILYYIYTFALVHGPVPTTLYNVSRENDR